MSIETYDTAYSLSSAWNDIQEETDIGEHVTDRLSHGCVVTRHGLIQVRSYREVNRTKGKTYDTTLLHFVHGQQIHRRIIRDKFYSKRYLVTLAKRFAEEIATQE